MTGGKVGMSLKEGVRMVKIRVGWKVVGIGCVVVVVVGGSIGKEGGVVIGRPSKHLDRCSKR